MDWDYGGTIDGSCFDLVADCITEVVVGLGFETEPMNACLMHCC